MARYCPCGEPCIRENIPYVRPFNASQVAHTFSYNLDQYEPLKLMTSLCSLRCYQSVLDDPNHKKFSKR